MAEGLDLGAMLSKIAENPEAREMLSSLLGSASPLPSTQAEEESQPTMAFPAPPKKRGHGAKRREMLLTLRPYLGPRRCASVDRMIRALELYEIIEETSLLKGGK